MNIEKQAGGPTQTLKITVKMCTSVFIHTAGNNHQSKCASDVTLKMQ